MPAENRRQVRDSPVSRVGHHGLLADGSWATFARGAAHELLRHRHQLVCRRPVPGSSALADPCLRRAGRALDPSKASPRETRTRAVLMGVRFFLGAEIHRPCALKVAETANL